MKYVNATSIQRFLAFFIDYFIINFISVLILGFIPFYKVQNNTLLDMIDSFMLNPNIDLTFAYELLRVSGVCLLLQSAVIIPIIIVYQVILPLKWKSQTVGRLIAGVKVVRLEDDKLADPGRLLLREVIAGYFINILFVQTFIVPIINYVLSRNRGRSIADKISKTRLIDSKLGEYNSRINEDNNEEFIDAEFKESNEEIIEEDTEYKVF